MQMFVRPSRDLRNHYAEISEMLKDHDHVIITNHGRGESVLINIEDYAKYEEFLHQRYVAEALAKARNWCNMKTAYLRYVVCGCCLCVKNANGYSCPQLTFLCCIL